MVYGFMTLVIFEFNIKTSMKAEIGHSDNSNNYDDSSQIWEMLSPLGEEIFSSGS